MEKVEQSIVCSKCGHKLPDEWISEATPDQTCDQCGASEFKIHIAVTEEAAIQINAWMKAKNEDKTRPRKKRVRQEVFAGDDLRVSKGDYVEKLRVIDKDNDVYIEKIVDKTTKQVIHSNEEPLSEHFGHGSAKFKKDS